MAHFAKLNGNNIVIEVNVVNNDDIGNLEFPESEQVGIDFLVSWLSENTYWKQTSYNGSFRKNYAGVGFSYDANRDAFIPPKPFQSWVLNEESCLWQAPVPYPTDVEKLYEWNEELVAWVEITNV